MMIVERHNVWKMFLGALLLTGGIAHSQENLATVVYEYRVKDYVGSYPPESERTFWDCWDDVAKLSIGCNFIRGDDIYNFRHVFRRVGGVEQQAQNQTCDGVHSRYQRLEHMREKWNEDLDAVDNTACASVPLDVSRLTMNRLSRSLLQSSIENGCLGQYELDHMADLKTSSDRSVSRAQKSLRGDRADCEQENADEQARATRATDPNLNARSTSDGALAGLIAASNSGRIACFGNFCGSSSSGSPAGSSHSTITARQWGDRAGPERNTGVNTAR